jgi:hypothetical protein
VHLSAHGGTRHNQLSLTILSLVLLHLDLLLRIRPANAGLDLGRENCPVLRQKRIDLISRRRIEACQDVG